MLSWEKSHFMVREGVVLGHIVSSKVLEVDKAKIEVIQNLPLPCNVRDLSSFLEHVSFYYPCDSYKTLPKSPSNSPPLFEKTKTLSSMKKGSTHL